MTWSLALVSSWTSPVLKTALSTFLSAVSRPRIYLRHRSYRHSFPMFFFLTSWNSQMITLTPLLNHCIQWGKFGSLFKWNPWCLLKVLLCLWRDFPDSWSGPLINIDAVHSERNGWGVQNSWSRNSVAIFYFRFSYGNGISSELGTRFRFKELAIFN